MVETPMDFDGRAHRLRWLRRLGVTGFWFFLTKGLLWLIVPMVLVWIGKAA